MFALMCLVMAAQPCADGQVLPEGQESCAALDEAGEVPRPLDPATRPPLERGLVNFLLEASIGSINRSVSVGASVGLVVNPLRTRRGALGFSVALSAVSCSDGCAVVGVPVTLRGGLKFGVFEPMVRVGFLPAVQFSERFVQTPFGGYVESVSMFGVYFTVGAGVMIAVGRGGFVAGFDVHAPLLYQSGFSEPQGHFFLGYLF